MSFGEEVYAELRRRKIASALLYADIQALKAVEDAASMHALLASRGHEAGPARTEPLHFADWIEIVLLRSKIANVPGLVLFGS